MYIPDDQIQKIMTALRLSANMADAWDRLHVELTREDRNLETLKVAADNFNEVKEKCRAAILDALGLTEEDLREEPVQI